MRKSLAVLVASIVMLASATGVYAIGASISPSSQTHSYGVASHWDLSWSGYSPYEVLFAYGDGTGHYWSSTTTTSCYASHTYWPCNTTLYHQTLEVWDNQNSYAYTSSTATERGGGGCLVGDDGQ